MNLYFCSKLVEGIVHRVPHKILQWIVINVVNLIQLAIFSFNVDINIGYLTLVIFIYIWMTMVVLYFEINKISNESTIAANQHPTGVEDSHVSYVHFSSDKQEDWQQQSTDLYEKKLWSEIKIKIRVWFEICRKLGYKFVFFSFLKSLSSIVSITITFFLINSKVWAYQLEN